MPQGQHWTETLFDEVYLKTYGSMLTPERTAKESDFIAKVLELKPSERVLDLACGHGRHAIELARRGFGPLVGLDSNRLFLERAKKDAEAAGTKVAFVQGDMRALDFEAEFDVIYNYYSAMFYWDDATHKEILEGAQRALKSGGRLLIETVNRERIAQGGPSVRYWWRSQEDHPWTLQEYRFDLATSRSFTQELRLFPDGQVSERHFEVRLYALHELIALLSQAGFAYNAAYGDTDASPYAAKSPRMIVIATKIKEA
jgi:SAM-dependent methyltransferase